MAHKYAVLDSDMEYKKDMNGEVRVFDSVTDAKLYFTVGNLGFVPNKDDETVLEYRGNPFNKLKIIPYVN